MFPRIFLPDPQLAIEHVDVDPSKATVYVQGRCTQLGSCCPACQQASKRVHSWYERCLTDLPCSGLCIQLTLHVRRFFCDNAACPQKVFTERLPGVAAPYARRTHRLNALVQALAVMLGCRMTVRVLQPMAIGISLWTILRMLRQMEAPSRPTPRVLGVDDWAIRRGRRYGTLLIDLETGGVVDVLADRETQTLANWLRAHPGVEIISRDRAEAYAEGARQGAPDAIQVADRWHLLKNLGEMLVRVLSRHHRELRRFAQTQASRQSPPAVIQLQPQPPDVESVSVPQPTSRRDERFQQAHDLRSQGFTVSAIARQTGMDRKTVRKYLNLTTLPGYRPRRQRFSKLQPYQDFLLEHWQQGRRTIRQLWQDIRALGFTGSLSTVASFMAQIRKQQGLPPYVRTDLQCPTTPATLSPKQVAWLLLARPAQLDDQHIQLRSTVPGLHPEVLEAASAAQYFAQILRHRLVECLDHWLQEALHSTVREVRSLARGIQRDYEAVKAALTFPWSNGMTEGHVQKPFEKE